MADGKKERVGIVGAGRMGLSMLKHLVKKGYAVTVCDIGEKQREAARIPHGLEEFFTDDLLDAFPHRRQATFCLSFRVATRNTMEA